MANEEDTELAPELIQHMQKVGGQEYGRLAFEQFFGRPPQVDIAALTLMQKSASVADFNLYKAAEVACPEDPMRMYEELGGGFKVAGAFDREKGLKRVGQLLSGSRADAINAAKSKAESQAAGYLNRGLKHDPSKVTPGVLKAVHEGKQHELPKEKLEVVRNAYSANQANRLGQRASRLGKVLNAEESKVRAARVGAAGVGTAAVAGGAALANKNSDT